MKPYPVKLLFNIPVAAVSLQKIPSVIISLLGKKRKKIFFYLNAHCLNLSVKDKEYKKILQDATLVYPGGIGPVFASRILGRPLSERIPTPDFIDKIFTEAGKKSWSIYLLGARDGIAQKAAEKLKKRFPKLIIAGYHHGYFDKGEEKDLIKSMNKCKPTILLVGMGSPKQEKWIAENFDKIDAQTFWAVGALFDVISGKLLRAPKWMQKLWLEWLFRFFQEPRRLYKRYTIGNLEFILQVLKEFMKLQVSRYRHSGLSRIHI